jgi:arabinogalactan endo-1,4-beta-galactosidase
VSRAPRALPLALAALALAAGAARPATAAGPILGADLSSLAQVRAAGAVFRDSGAVVEPLALLRSAGFGLVRLRLWHSPAEPWNGLDSTLAAAARARDAGLPWMLDLHYSDTWADPGKQFKPAAWAALPFPALVDSVHAYTRAVLRACAAAGVPPTAVQLGNEVDAGLLWDDGRVGWPGSAWDTPAQWSRCTALLAAAARAVREELPGRRRPAILLHLATGGDNAKSRWFLDHAIAAGVAFDDIALSYYPWWHGGLPALAANLRDLASRYRCRVWIAETSYPWTLAGADSVGNFVTSASQLLPEYPASPEGQRAFLRELMAIERRLPAGRGAGVLWWEPALVPPPAGRASPCENLALFDFDGTAMPALRAALPRAADPTVRRGTSAGGAPQR